MKNVFIILLLTVASFSGVAYSQDTLRVLVRHATTQQPISGATVVLIGTTTGTTTDVGGYAQLYAPTSR